MIHLETPTETLTFRKLHCPQRDASTTSMGLLSAISMSHLSRSEEVREGIL
jgi:hypothetical protein